MLKNNISIILVEPQLGENIGTTARAMLNFGFENLILINPRDDWPNEYAVKAAAGADIVINKTLVYKSFLFWQFHTSWQHHLFYANYRSSNSILKTLLRPFRHNH